MSGAEIIAEVQAALSEAGTDTGNGALVAILTPASTGGNPWDSPSPASDPVDLVVIVDAFRQNEIDGARIQSGDKKLLAEAGVVVPKTGDAISVSGVAHRVENVWPLSPAGVAVMYTIQAREIQAREIQAREI